MNHKLETQEQYALISIKEPVFNASVAEDFEKLARSLFREGLHNIILDFGDTTKIETQGISILKKVNMLCSRELGVLVLVTKDDDFSDSLFDAHIPDAVILPTTEEGIDAVFMHDLENEFGAVSDDYEDDELDPEGFGPESTSE